MATKLGTNINLLSYFDFQLSNFWDIYFVDIPNTLDFKSIAVSTAVSALSAVITKIRVTNIDLPQPKLETTKRDTGEKFYTGYEHPEEFSIELYETTDWTSYWWFKWWMEQVYDSKNKVFKTNPPRKNAFLTLSNGLDDIPTKVFVYSGVKILNIDDLSFSRDGSEPVKYKVNFVFEEYLGETGTEALIQLLAGSAIANARTYIPGLQ